MCKRYYIKKYHCHPHNVSSWSSRTCTITYWSDRVGRETMVLLQRDTIWYDLCEMISIHLRWSHGCLSVYINVCVFVCQLRASFTYIGQLLRCAHKSIVNIMKVYIERNNMQVELIRVRRTYRLYSRLRLRSEDSRDPRNVYSLFARWQQLSTTKLITIQCQPIHQMAAPHA